MNLAEKFESGELSSKMLLESGEEELKVTLLGLKGVGPWTVSGRDASRSGSRFGCVLRAYTFAFSWSFISGQHVLDVLSSKT